MLSELAVATHAELVDPNFAGRKHYSRSTYKDGCHGPLCLKSERDKAARRYAAKNPERKPKRRTVYQVMRDDYLEKVISTFGLRSEAQSESELIAS
jgi:hypothetical protein